VIRAFKQIKRAKIRSHYNMFDRRFKNSSCELEENRRRFLKPISVYTLREEREREREREEREKNDCNYDNLTYHNNIITLLFNNI